MLRKRRKLTLDVYDYAGNKKCTLYDSESNISGQAANVIIETQRNGWKELSFTIPSTCELADGGQEDNFRLQFLKADFRIRAKYDDDKFDIFLISEPRVVHKAFSKDISVNAGHIAQLLKTKNLGLEFSDEEGNNVGTASELLATILEGTGWEARNVATFKEKRSDKEKIRSLKASAKTGAFKLISNMCDLFEAKPIYYIKYEENQDTHVIEEKRLVDIVPMNPFSEPEEGGLPDVTNDKVVELQYGKNVKNVTRTLNTENMVTKLYCYGAYGDKVSGYCGIDEWHHDEYEFTIGDGEDIAAGEECRIYVPSNKTKPVAGSNVSVAIYYTRYFTAKTNIASGTKLIWSLLDPASMLYVWDGNTAHRVYDERKSTGEIYTLPWDPQTDKTKTVVNEFSFLMDFDYYDSVGLLTDEMLQSIAEYQRNMPGYYKDERDAAAAFTEDITELANTIGSVNFVKLKTTGYSEDLNNWLQVSLDLDHTKDNDGVIYRTDYTVRKNKRFKWRVAKELKDNGDPVVDVASILYIIHANGTFDKIFLKQLLDANGNEIDYSLPEYKDAVPATLTLWRKYNKFNGASLDEVYLFQTRNVNGYLGAIEVADELTVIALDSSTEIVTEDHPVFFVPGLKQNIPLTSFVGHAWQWVYHAWDDSNPYSENPSELYFCYQDDGDVTWHIVYRGFGEPADNNITGLSSGDYFYSYDKSALHRYNGSQWIRIKSGTEDERLVATFGTVIRSCMTRDRNFHGYYQYESIQIDSDLLYRYGNELPVGNYAIEDEWGTYHAFTTKEPMSENDWFCYDSTNKWVVYDSTNPAGKPVEQVLNQTLKSKDFRFDNVFRANNDLLADALWETGGLAAVTGLKPNAVYIFEGGGENDNVTNKERSSFIVTYPNVKHEVRNLPSGGATVFYYTLLNSCLGSAELTENNTTFTTPANTRHIRFVVDVNQHGYMECYIENSDVAFFSDEQVYFIIASNREDYEHMGTITNSGELKGIVPLMAKFNEYADKAYEQDYPALIRAQETVKDADLGLVRALGDTFREGYWQKTDYVDGDEDKLYNDGLENLEKIAKPEAKYSVDYLDLYTANDEGFEYAADAVAENILWPDLEADFAVHLLDPEIDISKWAFIDKISKCYDLPQKTQISINTDLSTIAQHSFTDVMTHIADVALQASGKMEIYDRAASLDEDGSLAAESLEGAINADKLKIFGGSSTWYTDDKGNMMFVSADGESAMALTGNGFSIADRKDEYGDWVWRTFGTGKGFTADVITAGTLQAERVITSKLMSMLGEGLELSLNHSISLIVGNVEGQINTVNNRVTSVDNKVNNTVQSIVHQYAKTENATTPPEDLQWQDTPPTWENGHYIWEKTVTTYTDSQLYPPETRIVNITGATGSSGVTISDTSTLYLVKNNANAPSESDFNPSSTLPPLNIQPGYYLWIMTKVTYSDGAVTKSFSCARQGENGQSGYSYVHIKYADDTNGTNMDDDSTRAYIGIYALQVDTPSSDYRDYSWSKIRGTDGASIDTITNYYYALQTTDLSQLPAIGTSSWKTDPTQSGFGETNKYLWNYENTTYIGKSATNTTPSIIGVYAKDGDKGDTGVGIDSILEKYLISSHNTVQPNWSDASDETGADVADKWYKTRVPLMTETNKYLWNVEVVTYTEGNPSTGYPHIVGMWTKDGVNGTNGTNGTNAYTHIGYADDDQGGNYSPTFSGQEYIAIYSDDNESASEIKFRGKWTKLKGDKGDSGKGVVGIKEYYKLTNNNTAPNKPTSPSDIVTYSWSETPFTPLDSAQYLWNCEEVSYTEGPQTYSNPHLAAKYVTDGPQGPAGVGISSITEYYLRNNNSLPPDTPDSLSIVNWSTVSTNPDENNQYLWNCEVIAYNTNPVSYNYGTPHLAAKYTADGVGISSMSLQYATGNNPTDAPSTGWGSTPPLWVYGEYLWLRYRIIYDDDPNETNPQYTEPWCEATWSSVTTIMDTVTSLQNQVDEKIQTWLSSEDPLVNWTTAADKEKHNGDLLYYNGTSQSGSLKPKLTYIYVYNSNTHTGSWQSYSATQELFDEIDGKKNIYYGSTSGPFNPNPQNDDYLVDPLTGSTYKWNASSVRWEPVTDYESAIENIEVGGRNLLLGTSDLPQDAVSSVEFGPVSISGYYEAHNYSFSVTVNPENEYEWKLVMKARYEDENSEEEQTWTTIAEGPWFNTPGRYSITKNIDGTVYNTVKPMLVARENGSSIEYSRVKFEIGNKPTAWTAAPEDIQEAINTSVESSVGLVLDDVASMFVKGDLFASEIGKIGERMAKIEADLETILLLVKQNSEQLGNYATTVIVDRDGLKLRQSNNADYEALLTLQALSFVDTHNAQNVVAYFDAVNGSYASRLWADEKLSVGSTEYGYYDFIMLKHGLGEKWRNGENTDFVLYIENQPVNAIVQSNSDTAEFSVKCNMSAAYQWKYLPSPVSAWTSIPSATSSTLLIQASATYVDTPIKCEITANNRTIETNVVYVHCANAPSVLYTSGSQEVLDGTQITAKVIATNVSGYQWQKFANNAWSDLSNETMSEYSNVILSDAIIRCKLTNQSYIAYSDPIVYTIEQ